MYEDYINSELYKHNTIKFIFENGDSSPAEVTFSNRKEAIAYCKWMMNKLGCPYVEAHISKKECWNATIYANGKVELH